MARTIDQLIEQDDPTWPPVRSWAEHDRANPNVVFPPDRDHRDEVLIRLQVTMRSPLGALAYASGGITLHDGWLRLLGSGRDAAARSLLRWNEVAGGMRQADPNAFVLIADDVPGGFFALNGGRFGADGLGDVFYRKPDGFEWQNLDIGHTVVVRRCSFGDTRSVYTDFEELGCWDERPRPAFDQAYAFHPFLWTSEGRRYRDLSRRPVGISEIWNLKSELRA